MGPIQKVKLFQTRFLSESSTSRSEKERNRFLLSLGPHVSTKHSPPHRSPPLSLPFIVGEVMGDKQSTKHTIRGLSQDCVGVRQGSSGLVLGSILKWKRKAHKRSVGALSAQMNIVPSKKYSREKLYTPPSLPHFWPKGIFEGRGVGVYILRPHTAGILCAPPPPFYTPPTPRRVFSGVGVGVYIIWPVNTTSLVCIWRTKSAQHGLHRGQSNIGQA